MSLTLRILRYGRRLIPTALTLAHAGFSADLRLGLIGTDTSHVTEFTRILSSAGPDHVRGAQVTAAFKSGSADIPESTGRMETFAQELEKKWHVKLVERIADLCPLVDGILLESVDGRTHLTQFREAVVCGKPVFIDKPLAASLEDAREIAAIAMEHKVPWFSSSSLRFGPVMSMRSSKLVGAMVWGPGPLEEHHHLDLSWYAIHPVEMLFTLMGTGVSEVWRTHSPEADVITARWKDGRIGTVRAIRPYGDYGVVAFLSDGKAVTNAKVEVDYAPLLKEVVSFMRSGTPPVPNAETLEIFAFLDAAQRSREQGGALTRLR